MSNFSAPTKALRFHERKGSFASKQRGVVLVISLLLLLILTVIGIGLMNSTMMQERMAGNVRTQVLSFEQASGGVSQALDFFYKNIEDAMDDNSVSDPYGYGMACGFRHGDEDMHWDYPADGSFLPVSQNDNVQLEQRMYCCQNWVYNEDEDECFETPSTLFVLSRGSLLDSEGANRLATREIEVRLEEAAPGEPTCAICMPGNVGEVDPPNAGGGIHGGCGPAITVEDPADAHLIGEKWESSSNSELTGGTASGDMGPPWNDPLALAEFVFWAKLGGPFRNGITVDYKFDDDIPNQYGTGQTQSEFGELDNPHITYFDNHSKPVKMHSNPTGAGLMILRGEAEWGGTPDFEGLIVVLGGKYETYAGGGGGGLNGSMVVTDLEVNPSVDTNGYDFLGGPEVLQYPVAKDDDGNVKMDDQGMPVLQTDPDLDAPPHGLEIFFGGRLPNGDPILTDDDGQPLGWEWAGQPYQSDIIFGDPAHPTTPRLRFETDPDSVPRDKFGRLIPDFFAADNWPPEAYGYSPNEWRWDPPGEEPFEFGLTGSDLIWSTGGGSQAFNYDCRMLHRMRHRLLCEEKDSDHDPELDVNDDFYDDPEYSEVCHHYEPDYEYLHEEGLSNQFAWHMWQPSCECMGITVDTDMILSGWRENLGWRDDGAFVGCESFRKSVSCPSD